MSLKEGDFTGAYRQALKLEEAGLNSAELLAASGYSDDAWRRLADSAIAEYAAAAGVPEEDRGMLGIVSAGSGWAVEDRRPAARVNGAPSYTALILDKNKVKLGRAFPAYDRKGPGMSQRVMRITADGRPVLETAGIDKVRYADTAGYEFGPEEDRRLYRPDHVLPEYEGR
jgi:hypothetical protein